MSRSIPEPVVAAQHKASDPSISAWVSANAGAGKTHVLAQRVIRLLLEGTPPARILCLTFTKAAAANMANRIFETLGRWSTLGNTELERAIRDTGAKSASRKTLAEARRLFAATLDTPGGLKVQTIHGFCTNLLQQFPFEANVAAGFRVLEETEQVQLLEEVRHAVLLAAASQPGSAMGRALAAIVPLATDGAFRDALDAAIAERDDISAWLGRAGGLEGAMAELSGRLGLQPGDTSDSIAREIADGPNLPSRRWAEFTDILRTGSPNDHKQAGRLKRALAASGSARVDTYCSLFFTDKGERSSLITKPLAKEHPALAALLAAEQPRLAALIGRRNGVVALERTTALLTIAGEVFARYAARKNHAGLLDFDDLIARTHEMLVRSDPSWVHYKLDLGIDHLLIDEAQDTSPQQWDIIKRFVAEFTAGEGARGHLHRTIFAVGDDKQSIFSFQGAAPEAFAENRRYFEIRHGAAKRKLESVSFRYSFRSVPAVLQAVDQVFSSPETFEGLSADKVQTVHEAVRDAAPGLVELWELVVPEEREPPEPWDAPFDASRKTSSRVKLAQQIAGSIRTWLGRGERIGDGDARRAMQPGDILVLVRQRGPLFEAIIRSLKGEKIPAAGADRLVLTEHIAVMDLLALADVVLHPDDDLSLATVLKSPLFGLGEQDLFALAHDRGPAHLHEALRARQPELASRLDAMARAAAAQRPFEFYAGLLGRAGARRRFLERLGPEASDALDEFLNLALTFEAGHAPTLQGFVSWVRTASADIKRDMEAGRNEVRVMTVHGAKGLEAPVVILADTTHPPGGPPSRRPRLLTLPGSGPGPHPVAWAPNGKADTQAMAAARGAELVASEHESLRLLYVAMTRAADRLIVCGARGRNAIPARCWYELVSEGLLGGSLLVEAAADFGGGTVRRFSKMAGGPEDPVDAAQAATVRTYARPDWLDRAVEPELARPAAVAPSRTGADDASGDNAARRMAMRRGVIVHRLMQSLPEIAPEHRDGAARAYLARQDVPANEREEIAAQVSRVLQHESLALLFAPGSRAEVPIAAIDRGAPVNGVVDRLAVTAAEVLIADYKTNRPPPRRLEDVPHGYIRQLAIYRQVIGRLYPGRRVRAALLWTEVPELMELPAERLDLALRDVTSA